MDESIDDIPVRDEEANYRITQHDRKVVEKWTREDIESNYLQLYSDNIMLKRHERKQEERIKKMETKLKKLMEDNKKLKESSGAGGQPVTAVARRDAELQSKIEDLNMQIIELQRENNALKDKVAVARQQLSVQGKPKANPAYSYVNHRVDTGRGVRPDGNRFTPRQATGGGRQETLPRYGHSLLEEERAKNAQLREIMLEMEQSLNETEMENNHLKEQLRQQEMNKNDDMMKYREAVNVDQKSGIQENVEIIKLQREIKEKSTRFTSLQLQYQTQEEQVRSLKTTNEQLLSQLDRLNRDLQEMHATNADLQGRMRDDLTREKALLEMKHRLQLLEQENNLLKSNNESLMKTALDTERDSAAIEREKELRLEIAKLQASLKGDLSDKGMHSYARYFLK